MPVSRTIHYNPKNTNYKARCGRILNQVKWTEDKNDVTCNNCIRLMNRG